MASRFSKVAVVALWLAPVMAVLLPARAAAQTRASVALNDTFFERDQPRRPAGQLPRWINRADCLADDVLHFRATVSPVRSSSLQLQVWAGTGTDCTQDTSRGTNSDACWLVYSKAPDRTPYQIDIRAQDIVARNYPSTTGSGSSSSGGTSGAGGAGGAGGTASGGSDGAGGSGGSTSSSGTGYYKPGVPEDCNEGSSASALTLYFMYVEGQTVVGTVAKWVHTGVDTSIPSPPSNVTAGAGEGRLLVGWDATQSDDFLEWHIYCDPPPGPLVDEDGMNDTTDLGLIRQAQAIDAGLGGSLGAGGTLGTGGGTDTGGAGGTDTGGASGSGGTGGELDSGPSSGGTVAGSGGSTGNSSGGSTSGEACGNGPLVAGQDPPSEAYRCGTVTVASTRRGSASGLVNGVTYAVAVAGVDTRGNVGKLSNVACGTPKLHTDFFELYKKYGGDGGGGFCSISSRSALTPALGIAALSLVGLGLLRRRKRNR